jgi:hypothetical protein
MCTPLGDLLYSFDVFVWYVFRMGLQFTGKVLKVTSLINTYLSLKYKIKTIIPTKNDADTPMSSKVME